MRFINTKVHGILDYASGVLLIAAPWLFGFADGGPDHWIPVAIGIVVLVMSLFTDYEFGLIRNIPMTVHLSLDGMAGLLLAFSPWLFGFAGEVYWPHLLIGIFAIFTSFATEKDPTYKKNKV